MSTAQPIRFMIVDDHAMVRKGLITFLKNMPDLTLVGEACDGREAIEMCGEYEPDVILMDLVIPLDDPPASRGNIAKTTGGVKGKGLTNRPTGHDAQYVVLAILIRKIN